MKAIIETLWGLLVEDGSLAVGILVALAITWVAASALGERIQDQAGWLLLGMVTILMLANLQLAGRKARRTRS